MVVVSDPLSELVGQGRSAKYVTECKEMYLGGKSIEKIRGFERLVNLECLWLNNNKLKKLNNLDANFRIKILCVQDNQICTLKGSLEHFKFLEQLDLSNNQLRDLQKLLPLLAHFKFLTHLNLASNPCCEEPDYRFYVIHALPSLRVLDQHEITALERRKAAGLIGGDVATLTVAFLQRVPQYDPAWDTKVPERSELEVTLMREAAATRDKLSVEAWERDQRELVGGMTEAPVIQTRGRGLPPNAGTQRALDSYATKHAEEAVAEQQMMTTRRLQQQQLQQQQQQQQQQPLLPAVASTSGRGGLGTPPPMVTKVLGERSSSAGGYRPQDSLDLFSLQANLRDLGSESTRLNGPAATGGTIRFEQDKYEHFVKTKAAGQGHWEATKTRVVL